MRRIVTENSPDGKSRIMKVAEVEPMGMAFGKDGRGLIWESDAENPLGFEPRFAENLDLLRGGLKAVHVSIPPDASIDRNQKFEVAGVDENGFHRTGTLDFVILLEGEITLELDDESIRLEVGDVVVQRDTNHAWRNTGDKPNRILGILHTPKDL